MGGKKSSPFFKVKLQMKKIFGLHSKFFHSSSIALHPNFPVWNGPNATNFSLIQEAYDSRIQEQQQITIDQYYTIDIPTSDYRTGCLAPNGCIYFMPFNTGKKVLKLDTSNDTYEYIGSTLSANYQACVLAEDGCIYSAPFTSGGNYLKIDPSTDAVEVLGVASSSRQTWGAVLSPNNRMYHGKTTTQFDGHGELFIIESQAEYFYYAPVMYPGSPSGPMRLSNGGAVLAANNIIYQAADYYSYQLMAINPETGSVYAQGNVGNSGTWWANRNIDILGSYGNKIYLMVNRSIFRIYDVSTNTYQTLSFPVSTITTRGTLASNGCMYFIAYNFNGYIKLNTLTNEITTISVPNALINSTHHDLTFAPNGKIYHAHGNKIHVLNITDANYPIDFCLSRYFNHA